MTSAPDEPSRRPASPDVPAHDPSPYWGPWTALLLVAAILAISELIVPLLLSETAYLLPYAFPTLLGRPSPMEPWLSGEGGAITLFTLAKLPVGIALAALFVRLRRTQPPARYLALMLPRARTVALWMAAQLVLTVGLDALRVATGRALVPPWMHSVISSAPSIWLLGVAVILAAPVYEELMFRGFLLPSLAATRLRTAGAVLITAALFAFLHRQYDIFDVFQVFLLGAFLGWARVRTGSTALAIAMHALVNAVALAETLGTAA